MLNSVKVKYGIILSICAVVHFPVFADVVYENFDQNQKLSITDDGKVYVNDWYFGESEKVSEKYITLKPFPVFRRSDLSLFELESRKLNCSMNKQKKSGHMNVLKAICGDMEFQLAFTGDSYPDLVYVDDKRNAETIVFYLKNRQCKFKK